MKRAMNAEQLARCDREIEAMRQQPPVKPAYLVAMGINDWQRERELIEQEAAAHE